MSINIRIEAQMSITGFEPVTCRLKVGSSDQTELYGSNLTVRLAGPHTSLHPSNKKNGSLLKKISM